MILYVEKSGSILKKTYTVKEDNVWVYFFYNFFHKYLIFVKKNSYKVKLPKKNKAIVAFFD